VCQNLEIFLQCVFITLPMRYRNPNILLTHCETEDGFYSERPAEINAAPDGPKGKPKVLVKIPQKVIKNAVGLAIFTTMRTGLWVSGSGGSGVLVARLPDGSWSPPSGLLIHTIGAGFMAGIDIYDCVLVINTPEALAAFQKVRLSLGGEISVAAGPVGIGGVGELSITGDEGKKRKPVFSYMKSRGLYAGVQIDGSIVIERNDENARFYGERLPAAAILSGKLGANVPHSTRLLTEVLKQAEGRQDINQTVLKEVDEVPAPGDMEVEKGAEPTQDLKEKYGHQEGGTVRFA
jgi:lipid-binding SYLF domain-containing protein